MKNVLALLVALGAFGPKAPSCSQALFVEGVTLVDGTGRPPVQDVDTPVVDGRFRAIGNDLAPPAGATRIVGSGKFAIPGLINMDANANGAPS